MPTCRLCAERTDRTFTAREMMHGTREQFSYFECEGCGSVQITRLPVDLGAYYPADYFPFSLRQSSRIARGMKRARAQHLLGRPSPLGRLIVRAFGIPEFIDWIRPLQLSFDSAILDVGCGSGQLLYEMRAAGFRTLSGIDPFVPEACEILPGIRIIKGQLRELGGTYDLLIMNHVIEHVENPLDMLQQASDLLSAGGHLLVRTPVAGTYAWRTYGADWVQLDPPRHLIVHSERSLRMIAEQAGFEVTDVVYDSTPFQFWASEQYQRDIPLIDEHSYFVNPSQSQLDPEAVGRQAAEAERLNRMGDGDQARFYLRRR